MGIIKKIEDILKIKWVRILLSFLFVLFLLDFIFPVPHTKPYSKTIYAKDGTLLTSFLTEDDKWRLRTNLEDVSPDIIKAIIAKEDKNFFAHWGFDPAAIVKAFINNVTGGKKVSGASTITMQVVRILEPKRRTYLNKFFEIIRAIQFELHFSKKEILSIYLSHLPMGGNIEGIKSASYIYFNHHPKTLSLSQAIMLSVIPGNPNLLRLDRINEATKKKRDYWIQKFLDKNIFPKKNLIDALNEPVMPHRFAVPMTAPHLCYFLKNKSDPNNDKVESTLDLRIQQTAENILLNYINRIRSKNISNGSVLIIDNHNSSVAGYCGSADFNNKKSMGQVNGIIAERSPGSTLKPALYAEGFELGFLTPGTKVLDVPIEVGGYEPENYSLKYNGLITSEFALVNSLNIPAVLLLNQFGVKNFIDLLKNTGFNKIKEREKKLGLSMILGGCGVTAEELGRLYSIFARGGLYKPLVYKKSDLNDEEGVNIYSEETCYLIADILSKLNRNDRLVDVDYSKLSKFAWKTGTSYGKRDAWAVGFNPNYTIVAWVGNFSGKGSPFLSGAESALPLLTDLFNAIDYNSKIKWFDKPQDIVSREVCSVSGLLPTDNCKELVTELAIKNRSHNNYCDIHQEIILSNDESVQYCKECLPDSNYKKKVYEIFNPELVSYYKNNNIGYDSIPKHNPDCSLLKLGEGPKITSPSESFEYYIDRNELQEIVLSAASDPKVKYEYWYVNDKLISRCRPGEKVFHKFSFGKSKIVCMDDLGRSKKITINVKGY